METMNNSTTDPLATPTDGSAGPAAAASDNLGPHDFQAMVRGPPAKLDSDLEMIVNVTREYPFDYATVMFGYIMPFVLVLTLITNTLVVMVLAQRHMRTPTNIVLFTMAIVDLMTLLSPSPWYFYIYTLGYHDKFLYPPLACYAHYYMTDVIPVFFHTSSIWLALLLAGQRYIYVCHPSLASTWCTVPRVRKAIVVILVVAFLHQTSRFFDNKFEAVSIQFNQLQHRACRNEVSEWVQSIDIGVYYITYYTFRIVFVFIIPCVALITLNCLLFRALRRAENKRSELLKTKFKCVAGTRSSVAGYEPPASSCAGPVIRNECSGGPRPASNSRWPNRRKISSPLVRLSRNTTDGADTEDTEQAPNAPGRGVSVSATRPTGTQDQSGGQRAAEQRPSNKSARNRNAASDKTVGPGSDSNESESLLGDPRDSRRPSKRALFAGSRRGMREQHQQLSKESNESYSLVSNRDENQSKSKLSDDDDGEDEEPCPGCAYCEQQHQQLEELRCRRCLTSSTSTANHCPQHHQPVSQCSSLAGGATNTTTNDEVSSCGNTHNISSSLYVVHDNTMDGIECSSIKEDQEHSLLEAERENVSLGQNNSNSNSNYNHNYRDKRAKRNRKSVSADGATRPEPKLTKSNSIDSRLVCGCPASPQRRVACRCSRLGSSRADTCRECCLANRCAARQQTRSRAAADQQLARSGPDPMQKCVASCSSSDPCIKCNNQPQLESSSCKSAAGREPTEPTGGAARRPISQSTPDYYAERCAVDASEERSSRQRSTADIYLDGNAAATTTTTTTLYSIQANSVGSLLQAQAQGQKPLASQSRQRSLCTPQLGLGLALGSGLGQDTRAKSPSFVSTMGRGSRATLVGNHSAGYPSPPTLVVTTGNYPVASLRTMDSNRTTLMLIVVVTVFLMVEVPVAIVTISHVVLNSFEAFKDVEFSAYLNYIKLFTNFFIMISYSVNFTIYCSMSKKFRETFRDLFLCGRQARRKRAAGLLYQQNQHSQYMNNNNASQIANNNNSNNNNNNNNNNKRTHSQSPCPNLLLGRRVEPDQQSNDRAKSCTSNEPAAAPASRAGEQSAEQRTAAAKRYAPAYKTIGVESRQEECEL